MRSTHVLVKGAHTTTLKGGRLTLSRGRRTTTVPLAAVQEVRPHGATALTLVLTDGATRRLPGGTAHAADAFRAALTAALPERRDPAGSALLTERERRRRPWLRRLTAGAVGLAYAGYVLRVAVGPGLLGALTSALGAPAALLGLLAVRAGARGALVRARLARRGVTVMGVRGRHPDGTPHGGFTYTDALGNEYGHAKGGTEPAAHLVYDPESPRDSVLRQPAAWVVAKYGLGFALALAVLALGTAGLVRPYV
ncbi:hypothetical protein ACIQRS_08445 [Streptomyces termitum]|uniref:Uncharacterized protein n=1 Tax=Streptomyces termitum TaxID=67368 RepID=A0A918SPV7_9ACTN|nr:hypothetical protein [Streptomyces termitum]GHA64606.1 hypothetical protein GCM10010305_02700 [Streptomyces termitum]